MRLEMHDNVVGNSLYGQVNDVESLEEANEWVNETCYQYPRVRRWVLLDDDGEVVECWERRVGSFDRPKETIREIPSSDPVKRVVRNGRVHYIRAETAPA